MITCIRGSLFSVPANPADGHPLFYHYPSSTSTKSLRYPMGSCFSKHTVDETSLDTRGVTPQEPVSSHQQTDTNPGREAAQVIEVPSHGRLPTRNRTQSTPHKVPPMNDVELPPLPRQTRARAKSYVTSPSSSSRGPNLDQRQTSAEHSRTAPKRNVMDHYLPRRPLGSTVQGVVPEDFRFRLLVVGKRQSGKSSLAKAVFKVDVTVRFYTSIILWDCTMKIRPN